MKIEEKKVLVVGTGISGIAAAKLLLEKKIEIILHDLTGQGGRCRLSVRSGDCDQSAFSKMVSKLDFSPNGNILCTKTLHHRKIRRNSRA